MSLVPMGGNKVVAESGAGRQLSGRLPEHRPRRREPRARIAHLARGAGRVRAAQPSARARGDRRGPVRRRDRAADVRAGRCRGNGGAPTTRDVTFARRRRTAPRHLARSAGASCGRRFTSRGTVTAGNSSQTSDGAAAVLVTSAELREGARPDAARRASSPSPPPASSRSGSASARCRRSARC